MAEHYGFEPNRAGFIRCPFHQDKTPSLKFFADGGWKCFGGCGKGGSCIDFVMELFDLNLKQAVLRLNADFNLGLSGKKPTRAEHSKYIEQRQREQAQKEQKEAYFWYLISKLWYWREVVEVFAPQLIDGEAYFHPLYAEAVKKLPYIDYLLDVEMNIT